MPWNLILKFCAGWWRELLIASLLAALWLAHGQTRRLETTLSDERAEFREAKRLAESETKAVADQAKLTLEKINADHDAVLEQAKKQAQENFARYLAAASARRSWLDRVPVEPHVAAIPNPVVGSEAADARPSDPMVDRVAAVIDQCAETTVLFNEWRATCAGNPKLCKVME